MSLERESKAEKQALERGKRLQKEGIEIKKRFGKNAILKGMNLKKQFHGGETMLIVSSETIMQSAAEVLAYGTAVKYING